MFRPRLKKIQKYFLKLVAFFLHVVTKTSERKNRIRACLRIIVKLVNWKIVFEESWLEERTKLKKKIKNFSKFLAEAF